MRLVSLLLIYSSLFASLASAQGVLVSGYTSQAVHLYDELSGASLGTLGGLGLVPGAQSMRYGPDGDLYVVSEEGDEVLRFDGVTGAPLGVFVGDDPLTPQDESGGLDAPTGAVFGPDGNLYVGSFSDNTVRRYDGSTGAYLGLFVTAGDGGLSGPDAGLEFGPDGHLYVPSFNNNRVLRYDGTSGVFLNAFVGPSQGGLSRPRMLRFRSDGVLYVSSWGNSRILRYDHNGVFIDTFIQAGASFRPTGFAFEPGTGHLLIASDQIDLVRRYDGESGAFLGVVVANGAGGLDGGTFVEYIPERELRLSRLSPGTAASLSHLTLRGASPGGLELLLFGNAVSSQVAGICAPTRIGVSVVGFVPFTADANGEVSLPAFLPASLSGQTFTLQYFEIATCRPSNLVIQKIP